MLPLLGYQLKHSTDLPSEYSAFPSDETVYCECGGHGKGHVRKNSFHLIKIGPVRTAPMEGNIKEMSVSD
jgi:hypothetical protein